MKEKKKVLILESVEALVQYLKSTGTEQVSIVTPQFERDDGILPVMPEKNKMWFDKLKTLPHETLKQLGLGLWDKGHYLFPWEWYNFIPEGYMVTSISGDEKPFKKGTSDNDKRYGCLPYGFIKPDEMEEKE